MPLGKFLDIRKKAFDAAVQIECVLLESRRTQKLDTQMVTYEVLGFARMLSDALIEDEYFDMKEK